MITKEIPGHIQKTVNEACLSAIRDTLQMLKGAKPNDRSEADRRYAVCITEQEKVLAYFNTYIMDDGSKG